MSPTARHVFNNISKKLDVLETFFFGDGTSDVADIYAMSCAFETRKRKSNNSHNKCPYCGQYGKRHMPCDYCGAPIE